MNIHRLIEKTLKIDSRYFLKGGFWLLTAQGSTILISLVGTIIFAHYLSTTDFGIYRYLISLGVLFGSFTLTGVGQAILQSAARKDTWYYAIGNRRTSQFNLVSSAIALSAALYYLYNENVTLAVGCVLIALLQPSSIYFLNALAFLHGQKKFKQATFLQTSRSLLITTSSIIAVLFTTNIIILIAVFLGSQAIAGIVSRYQTSKVHLDQNSDTTSLVRYEQIAIHTSLRNIIVGSAARLDSVIVFQQLGAASLATFTIATLLPEHIKGAFKNLPTLLIPRFTNRHDDNKPNLNHRTLQGLLLLIVFTTIIIFIIPYLYNLVFPKYSESIFYAQLLALSFPASVYHIHISWLQTQNAEKALYTINVITSFFQIVSTVLGVVVFGLSGVIGAKVLTQYFQLIIAWHIANRLN